jgi:cysteinyl-tRNA synthetase
VDNIFPHHENEIAQSEALSGKPFVRYWLHCHHLIVDGEKMSKSKGNQFTLRDLLARNVDPLALRFLLMSTHYRKTLNFTFEALCQAESSLQRIKDFEYELRTRSFGEGKSQAAAKLINQTKERFIQGLSDDLNISASLTALYDLIKEANILMSENRLLRSDAEGILNLLCSLDDVLAVFPAPEGGMIEKAVLDSLAADKGPGLAINIPLSDEVLQKIVLRHRARAERDFRLADEIRHHLLKQGIALEDTRQGVRWKTIPAKKQPG